VSGLEELKAKVISMDVDKVIELTRKALDDGLAAERIIDEALVPAMDIVGQEFERGERFIPEMMLSAKATKGMMEILRPLLVSGVSKRWGKVITGTVEGDLHDIGLNIVSTMLEGGGFEVRNLGVDVPVERFLEALEEHSATLLGMSALLTTTMLKMKEVIDRLGERGIREKVRVMIGGAPVTQDYADEIGADGYAPDAISAVELAKRLVGGASPKPC